MARRRLSLAFVVLALLTLPLVVAAQRGGGFGGGGGQRGRQTYMTNVPYDGRFTFTRIRYNAGTFGSMASAWNHDYPNADLHLPLILRDVTAIPTNVERTRILDLEDPEIFQNPILYMWEPGYWQITAAGAENLGNHLRKGGFIIFDDFESERPFGQWENFEEQFRRAIPGAEWVLLELSHPVYHSFFDMAGINLPHPNMNVKPGYFGVFEDNDPSKRLIALANFNSDVAEYWEWSGTGQFAVNTTNDAYKLGVNYFIYGLTH